jgi:hypothetical protein
VHMKGHTLGSIMRCDLEVIFLIVIFENNNNNNNKMFSTITIPKGCSIIVEEDLTLVVSCSSSLRKSYFLNSSR